MHAAHVVVQSARNESRGIRGIDRRLAPVHQIAGHRLAPMAAGAVMYNFAVQLADVDRGVYEEVTLRAARHPSETDAYMMTRVLAYCLEFVEGITFSDGISSTDEPAVLVRDLTKVGAPSRGMHVPQRPASQCLAVTGSSKLAQGSSTDAPAPMS